MRAMEKRLVELESERLCHLQQPIIYEHYEKSNLQTLSLIADACIETLKENKGVIVLILTCGQSRNNASYIIATNDTKFNK